MASISFAITVCNEIEEIKKLLPQVKSIMREDDEIIVLVDSDNSCPEIEEYLLRFGITLGSRFHRIYSSLKKDFASFKNFLKKHCVKDWIFFIDADEMLSDDLGKIIHDILDMNDQVDIISVPRVNKVDGLTREHIQKWRWGVDEKGRINFPDYQTRICKNSVHIEWINKVHERLSGWKNAAYLPPQNEYSLFHYKSIEKQERQNEFYDKI